MKTQNNFTQKNKSSCYFLSALIALGAASLNSEASCGSAYCTLNTQWATQGYWSEPGFHLDLRYENIDQNQVVGTPDPTEDHREIKTQNDNFQATLDYSLNDRWGLSLSLPVVRRQHEHWHVDGTNQELESWNFSQIGDAKIMTRLSLSDSSNHSSGYGIQFGLKLPSGSTDIKNQDGELAERSLQPGTGTTDSLTGAYYFQQLPQLHSRWFAQIQLAHALNEKDQFKPGNSVNVDLGYAYNIQSNTSLVLQLNSSSKSHDWGTDAEPENSGGTVLSLSPGINYSLNRNLHLYAFIHHRLTENLSGAQLSAKNSFVLGSSLSF